MKVRRKTSFLQIKFSLVTLLKEGVFSTFNLEENSQTHLLPNEKAWFLGITDSLFYKKTCWLLAFNESSYIYERKNFFHIYNFSSASKVYIEIVKRPSPIYSRITTTKNRWAPKVVLLKLSTSCGCYLPPNLLARWRWLWAFFMTFQ